MTELEQAQKNLQDYFDSLPTDSREKALKFQAELELEAKTDEGGMNGVIAKRLQHNKMLLQESLEEVVDIASLEIAKQAISKYTL